MSLQFLYLITSKYDMLKPPGVVDRVDYYLNLDGQVFGIHSISVITFLPKKRFFIIKRNGLGVVIICLLRNFNTTKVTLFKGCVSEIMFFA